MKVRRIRSANGPLFGMWCPGCEHAHIVNQGWGFNGDDEKPSFTPSIMVTYTSGVTGLVEERCHSYVTGGKWIFLTDCTHALAGKTVDVPEWPAGYVVHEPPE